MKLKSILQEDELYINRECYFIKRYHMAILDSKNKKIGEAFGHLIDTEKVATDIIESKGSNFFIELDCVSQLLCECAEYIINNIPLKKIKATNNILFLNRLSLDLEYISDENDLEALELLFENAEMIIYSFGYTELDDGFPFIDETYFNSYEALLKKSKWKYNEEYEFYIKIRKDLWTKGKIVERLFKPFTTIKVNDEDFRYWEFIFDYIHDIEFDNIKDMHGDFFIYETSYINSCLLNYDFARTKLDVFENWEIGNNPIEIELSPFSISVFLEKINSIKKFTEYVEWEDEEIANGIEKHLNKYKRKLNKLKKDTYMNYIYLPIIKRNYANMYEFTCKKEQKEQ